MQGENQGCGGIVNLTEASQHPLRAPDAAVTPRNGRIEGELDCQWTVLASAGKVIRNFSFNKRALFTTFYITLYGILIMFCCVIGRTSVDADRHGDSDQSWNL